MKEPAITDAESPRFTIGDVALVLLAGFISALLATVVLAVVNEAFVDDLVLSILVLLPAQYLGQIAAIALIVRHRRTTFELGLRLDIEPGDVFYTMAGLALQFALAMFFLPLYELTDVDGSGQTIVDVVAETEMSLAVMIILALSTALLAPVVEEMAFRGVLLRSLLRRFSARSTIVVSSVIFAAAHILSVDFSDPQWLLQFGLLVPQIIIVGVVLAWLTLKHDRLGPAIFTHAGFNLWLVIFIAGADYFATLE